MPPTHDEFVQDVVATYRDAVHAIHAASPSVWVNLDLPAAQLRTLMALAYLGQSSIGQLGETLGIGQSTASYLVDRLVQSGLAARAEDPADRRRSLVRLSPHGEDLVSRLSATTVTHLQAVLVQLAQEDLQALQQGLRALTRAAVLVQEREATNADKEGTGVPWRNMSS